MKYKKKIIALEYDNHYIQAVMIYQKSKKSPIESSFYSSIGELSDDEVLKEKLREIVENFKISRRDTVISILWGKQAYVGEISSSGKNEDEITTEIQFELRKTLTFDIERAHISYEKLANFKNETNHLAVTGVASSLIDRHIEISKEQKIEYEVIQVLPFALCNAFESSSIEKKPNETYVLIHFGSDITTLVYYNPTGSNSFYYRSIYFTSYEIFESGTVEEYEVGQRLMAFTDEFIRTTQFYEKQYNRVVNKDIICCGRGCDRDLIKNAIKRSGKNMVILPCHEGYKEEGCTVSPLLYSFATDFFMGGYN